MRHYIDNGKLIEFCSRFRARVARCEPVQTPEYSAAQNYGYVDSQFPLSINFSSVEEDRFTLELTSQNLEEIINTIEDFYSHLNGDKFRGTEGRDIYRHYLEREAREQLLRDNNPTLKNIWEQYQAVRALVLSNKENE